MAYVLWSVIMYSMLPKSLVEFPIKFIFVLEKGKICITMK